MDETMVIKTICKNSKTIIDKQIFLFVFVLFKKIFLVSSENENKEEKKKENKEDDKNNKINEKLKEWINYINNKVIKKEEKFISEEYSKENMKNIFSLVIIQNKIYAPDIIEGILIYIFSMVFITDKDKTLNEYIFNNISEKFKKSNYFDLGKMMDLLKIRPPEFRNINQLLILDCSQNEKAYRDGHYFKEEAVNSEIYNILYDILSLKYINIIRELKAPSKQNNYINKYIDKLENLRNKNEESKTELEAEYIELPMFVNEFYYKKKFGIDIKVPIKMFRSFLISVFIYHVNKTSPLIKYIEPLHKEEEEKKLAYIPFEYNLEGACIEERFSNIIISPARFEPRISKLNFGKNYLKSVGLYELGKLLIFNKNIKSVKLDYHNLTNLSLEYIKFGMRIHENYTLEELILINSPLTNQSGISLAKIITCFRGLKTLNLCDNGFKWGLSPFFIVLKKLYRKGKTKLESLKLNNCQLDNESFYELGELISSKYCKLKKLYLIANNNNIINFSHFLKKLKENNSITEIYLGNTLINNNDVDEILRVISNSKIRQLYLNGVKIISFIELLRIIYRTKIIKEENDEYININESFLFNLDLSRNYNIYFKSTSYIKLLAKIIENSTIQCLDISQILYGKTPDKFRTKLEKNKYYNEVENLAKLLVDKKEKYIKNMTEINKRKVDIERNKSLEREEIFKELDLDEIIENDNSKYPMFLRQEANKIVKDKFKDINDLNKKKDIAAKLIRYMTLKKSRYDLEILEKEVKDKKLIII